MHKDRTLKQNQPATSNKMMAYQGRPKGGDVSKDEGHRKGTRTMIGGGSGDIEGVGV